MGLTKFLYLNGQKMAKMSYNTCGELFDFLISRLSGRARDVFKVSLHSNSDLTLEGLPTSVFDVLERHFSDIAHPTMPMKDFYNTVPRAGESALDYWIRPNKSIDAVDDCLRRWGKHVDDLCGEAMLMFISHCPDPDLAVSFRFKPAEKWSAVEVQEHLDNHLASLRNVKVKFAYSCSNSSHRQDIQSSCTHNGKVLVPSADNCPANHNLSYVGSKPVGEGSVPLPLDVLSLYSDLKQLFAKLDSTLSNLSSTVGFCYTMVHVWSVALMNTPLFSTALVIICVANVLAQVTLASSVRFLIVNPEQHLLTHPGLR